MHQKIFSAIESLIFKGMLANPITLKNYFKDEKDDLDIALGIIMNSNAIKSSRKLAEDFAMRSKEAIAWLPDSEYKRALIALPEFVLGRLY